ncbi:MAG: anthranilate phosphoribosyltransferase [Planctomycetota bacterium]
MTPSTDARDMLHTLVQGEVLGEQEAETLFGELLDGRLDEAQTGAVLAMLAQRGVTASELTGAARAMRAHATGVPFEPQPGDSLIDTCGTGGAPKTFNISTATAIVAAAIDPPSGTGVERIVVAKHGNRSRTGRGSAEILGRLGVNIDATPEVQARCLAEVGVCFCFAIHHHPAVKHAMTARRSLGFPTIFNVLGPLTNPAGARRQLLGVYRSDLTRLVAQTLARLGCDRAMVAHGLDGLDELTTTAATIVVDVEEASTSERDVDPRDVGLSRGTMESLRVETLEEGERVVRGVLAGDPGPRTDIVLLNAAAAGVVSGAFADLPSAVEAAREAIASGRAGAKLEALSRASS